MRARLIAAVLVGLATTACGADHPSRSAAVRSAPTELAAADPSAGPLPQAPAAVAPAHPIPASFRNAGISPGAPSDAQVRAELKQMYAAQRQARSAAAANFAGLLPWVDEPKTGQHVSVASVFVDYGLGLACGGLLGVNEIGVAHKTAPCGTLIDFTYNGRTLQVPVIDRGPYIAGREWDLTGATARALGFPGLGPIQWSCASCG
ncbi:MAG TPA: septal ring lytic transglycosylase RlpA family protein [Solirubrobacteraceae bacterium]|nr:septal ring lytic transglycosylase RlpA family protein [Solirubrobacteraceae bacterium]